MSLLSGYAALPERYDELLDASGAPRAQWRGFLAALESRDAPQIEEALALVEREVRDHGVTYNVYADEKGTNRPWEVDPLPLMISAAEWETIAEGIAQRAALLNAVLGDLYGEQQLLRSGALPPAVVFGHGGFLHPAQGIRPPDGVHLFHYAADLARSPDGHWWVTNDRTQAPSGAGYALENRLIVARVFPQPFHDLQVQHLAGFFDALREALRHWAPRGDGPPLIVLLTPGPFNETYFEHALLARYLGFPLVEGNDLAVRDGRVWMKTIDGLKRVHAILRRQDDDFCDPLELRVDSALGIPGLTECLRHGSVFLANGLGSGVIESGALLGYLPALSEKLLGEPLRLPSVATWWLGEPAAFADASARLDRLIVKPLERTPLEPSLAVAGLSADAHAALRARIAARPQHYVAQEWVHVSQAPVLEPGDLHGLAPRTVGLRVFAVATPGGWQVMPGGLTRVAHDGDSRDVAMQRGGRSKDTWVLSDAPVNSGFSLLSTTVDAAELEASQAALPSRTAENLYWFGRYGERCDATARLLRVALGQLIDEAGGRADPAEAALALCWRLGIVERRGDPTQELRRAASHPQQVLAERLAQLSRVAFNLRDRMSADNWRALNRVTHDPVFRRHATLPVTLAWLDRAVAAFVTLSGFVLDGMTRGIGWRFLSLGRRIERLATMCTALETALEESRDQGLDWLLAFGDSTVSYRSRYLVGPEWLPVLDMLLRDDTNPRSVAFQAKGVAETLVRLEQVHGRFASHLLAPGHAALRALEPAQLGPGSAAVTQVLEQLREAAYAISDALALKFFSHATPRSVLALVA
jgi:uncharacterized circularly permuted ATP-grasp superfamily protein/uncharacterized alpha-E superfamily protein